MLFSIVLKHKKNEEADQNQLFCLHEHKKVFCKIFFFEKTNIYLNHFIRLSFFLSFFLSLFLRILGSISLFCRFALLLCILSSSYTIFSILCSFLLVVVCMFYFDILTIGMINVICFVIHFAHLVFLVYVFMYYYYYY